MHQLQQATRATNSWLFTPATRPDRFGKASEAGADVLIVDLEDAVAPSEKGAARATVTRLLSESSARVADVRVDSLAIRINSPSSLDGHSDITMLLESNISPRYVLVPKVESAAPLRALASLFREAGKSISIVPMIESAEGVKRADEIAGAGEFVQAIMFGAADYASDVGGQPKSFALELARCKIAAACVPRSVLAIDAPCFAIHEPEMLKADLQFALDNGYRAKAAIHPSHIAPINSAFAPTEQRLEWANRVLEAAGLGVAIVDGRMVDEAVAREARQVLASAR